MTIPFREFTAIDIYTLYAHDLDSHNFNVAIDWDLRQYRYGKFGETCLTAATNYEYWVAIMRVLNAGFADAEGLDHVAQFHLRFIMALEDNTGVVTCSPKCNACESPETWTQNVVSRFYDGANHWSSYGANGLAPPQIGTSQSTSVDWVDMPTASFGAQSMDWYCAVYWGATYIGEGMKSNVYRNGLGFYMFTAGYDAALIGGDKCLFNVFPQFVRVYYFNPVVNSLSTYRVRTGGGDPLVLTGAGFDIADAEFTAHGNGVVVGGGFDSDVAKIRFVGQQGQGTTEILAVIDFTVDSDSQITIPAMPNLAAGSYTVELSKNMNGLAEFYTFAGDWSIDSDGRVTESQRIVLFVGEFSDPDFPRTPVILTDWKFRDPLGNIIDKRYAEIDVRATNYFWEGRILQMDALTRSVDDLTGMYNVSDMNITLANNDKEFSKLLAQYILKNQIVGIYQLWGNVAAEQRDYILRMIVHDHDLIGDKLVVYLKDITDKFFATRDPALILTADEYPNIHASAIGKAAPHALGINEFSDSDIPGAIEARYVDTVNYKYLAAIGSLASVYNVYSDGVLQSEGAGNDYVISYADGGRTYIVFNLDQAEAKITFDCAGYIYSDWQLNSGDICVVNPAYVLLFYLTFIRKIPVDFLDFDSFHVLANQFENSNHGDVGRFIIQEETDAMNNVREMLMTFGVKMFPARSGKLTVVKKDETNIATDIHIFEQFHAKSASTRKFGLTDIVNFARSKFDYYPTASQYVGAKDESVEQSIENFGVQIESDSPFEFKWTNSESLVFLRLSEILRQRAYGYKTIDITIEFDWIDRLDITNNFKYQNPFGLDAAGDGEKGRYYYADQITYNWHEKTMTIHAIDLQWLVAQYFILGNRSALADLWSSASEEMRIYGYLCDRASGAFSTGDPGKRLSER